MKKLYTKKIYHKKFDHRIVFNTRQSNRVRQDKKQPTAETIEWLLANNFKDDQWRSFSTYAYVNHVYTITVYCKGPVVKDFLLKNVDNKYISELEEPMDAEHSELLSSNDKLVTRKDLFFKKYRMCLRVSPTQISAWQTSTDNIRKMQEWCVEQFGNDSDRYQTSGWARGNFYFADPKDALLFKLTWGGDDVKTERVITVDELEKMRVENN